MLSAQPLVTHKRHWHGNKVAGTKAYNRFGRAREVGGLIRAVLTQTSFARRCGASSARACRLLEELEKVEQIADGGAIQRYIGILRYGDWIRVDWRCSAQHSPAQHHSPVGQEHGRTKRHSALTAESLRWRTATWPDRELGRRSRWKSATPRFNVTD
jgi:hypothetical protein